MRVVEGVAVRSTGRAKAEAVLVEMLSHRCMRDRVIGLQSQQIVAPACQDPLGDRGLTPHSVQRHDAVLQGELIQQRRNGGDLVGLAINAALAKHQALLTGPGAHQVQGCLLSSMIKRASQRLAINGNHFTLEPGSSALLVLRDRVSFRSF